MFHLRLCKGLSYLGIVRATKAEPDVYVPEEEKAKALVVSGYFEMVTSEAEKIQPLTGDTEKGGAVPQELYKSPVAIPSMQVPGLSNDAIILAEPKNLIEVNTYSMKLRKDATSKDAIMQDKRFYVIHFDFDALIEEMEATAIITGLPEYVFS